MRKVNLGEFDLFSDAVEKVLRMVDGQDYGSYAYSIIPKDRSESYDGDNDCMIIGDGVALDFGEVVYCDKEGMYTAYKYQYQIES